VPIHARHRRRLWGPAIAVLGAVATGVLLVACSAANPPPAAPPDPDTTRPASSRAPTTTAGARGAELGVFEVSCHTGKGITASGRPSSRETVSVDPRVVPLGTRLVIDKVGTRVAADTGGAIRGRRRDNWEPSLPACTRFGRRQLRVWQAA
jgi:3D (Asp-Asp-Asp) domain-containing protein